MGPLGLMRRGPRHPFGLQEQGQTSSHHRQITSRVFHLDDEATDGLGCWARQPHASRQVSPRYPSSKQPRPAWSATSRRENHNAIVGNPIWDTPNMSICWSFHRCSPRWRSSGASTSRWRDGEFGCILWRRCLSSGFRPTVPESTRFSVTRKNRGEFNPKWETGDWQEIGM
jgi:hypothetical protein